MFVRVLRGGGAAGSSTSAGWRSSLGGLPWHESLALPLRPRDRVSAQQDGSEDGGACRCVGGERWRALRAGPAIQAARPFRSSLRDHAEIEATVSAHPSRRAADVRKGQPGRRRAGGCFASRAEERQGRPRASAIRPTGKDRRTRPGACSVYESDSAGPLADRRESDDRQAARGGTVGAGVVPAFMPKQSATPS